MVFLIFIKEMKTYSIISPTTTTTTTKETSTTTV
jgi:hypothetical protein